MIRFYMIDILLKVNINIKQVLQAHIIIERETFWDFFGR